MKQNRHLLFLLLTVVVIVACFAVAGSGLPLTRGTLGGVLLLTFLHYIFFISMVARTAAVVSTMKAEEAPDELGGGVLRYIPLVNSEWLLRAFKGIWREHERTLALNEGAKSEEDAWHFPALAVGVLCAAFACLPVHGDIITRRTQLAIGIGLICLGIIMHMLYKEIFEFTFCCYVVLLMPLIFLLSLAVQYTLQSYFFSFAPIIGYCIAAAYIVFSLRGYGRVPAAAVVDAAEEAEDDVSDVLEPEAGGATA